MLRVTVDLDGVGAIEHYGPDDMNTVEIFVSTNHSDLRLEIDPNNVDDWRRVAAKILSMCELVAPIGLELVMPESWVRPVERVSNG